MLYYTHITLEERKSLQKYLGEGKSIREIARLLGRSASSISREIKRNRSKKGYHHWRAQTLTIIRRRVKRRTALRPGSLKYNYVVSQLKACWSPEEIAMRFRLEHPNEKFGVSTIYRYLKRGDLEGVRVKDHLRRRGKRMLPRNSCYNTIQPDRLIPDWPKEIVDRLRVGDWEGDTVYGGVGKGLAVTLVDRRSRFLCAGILRSRNAFETRTAIVNALKDMPVYSISLDNGSEFSQFRALEDEVCAPVYFAEPHKPWQRGTNENTNDILRFFFPKGYDFHSLSADELNRVVDLINDRPRKCLGWRTPREVFVALA